MYGEHSWVVGNFPERAQHEIWDDDPHAVASASVAPNGSAEIVAGGYRLNGRWAFASGCDHAQCFFCSAPKTKGAAEPELRMFLIPRSEVEIIDDWDVIGLCGTGRNRSSVKDAAVPAHRPRSACAKQTGIAPGAAVHPDNPLYRIVAQPDCAVFAELGDVGLAERAVEEFAAITRERRSRGLRVADLEAVQLLVAEAAAQAEAAALVEQTIDRNTEAGRVRAEITAEQVAWTRRNSSYATQLSHSAVKLIFQVAGGTAFYAGNPLQEIFRDIMAASAHLSLSWHRAAPCYGQIRLGLPVDFDML